MYTTTHKHLWLFGDNLMNVFISDLRCFFLTSKVNPDSTTVHMQSKFSANLPNTSWTFLVIHKNIQYYLESGHSDLITSSVGLSSATKQNRICITWNQWSFTWNHKPNLCKKIVKDYLHGYLRHYPSLKDCFPNVKRFAENRVPTCVTRTSVS